MAIAAFNKFNSFVNNCAGLGLHKLGTDPLKTYLSNTAPNAATMVKKADLAEIAATGSYAEGTPAISSSSQTAGVYKLVLADVTWTAAGGSIGPFQYVVLRNSAAGAVNNDLIGWWALPSAITLTTGQTFTLDFDPSTGALTLA